MASGNTTYRYVITNNGTLTVNGATITGTATGNQYERGITNTATGNIVMSSGNVTASGVAIYTIAPDINNVSSIVMNGGTIHADTTGGILYNGTGSTTFEIAGTVEAPTSYTIYNYTTGDLTLEAKTGCNITSTSSNAVRNRVGGNVTIKGEVAGAIIKSTNAGGVYNAGAGTIEVKGGIITGGTNGIYNNAGGTIEVSGGSITGSTNGINNNSSGIINITGGQITGGTSGNGIYNKTTGSITIKGGYVTGGTNGIELVADSTLTMGVKDTSTPGTDLPRVTSNATATYYGVKMAASSTFNFYDGQIVARTNGTINRDVSDTPAGYGVRKTKQGSSREIATLAISNYAEYDGDTLKTVYGTLAEATAGATSGNTIKLLRDFTDTSTATVTNKQIGLDINGYTLTLENPITNKSQSGDTIDTKLNIYSSDDNGQIISSATTTIINEYAELSIGGIQGNLGDVNLDGWINQEDLTILANHLAHIITLTGTALTNADVNADGEVDASDSTALANIIADSAETLTITNTSTSADARVITNMGAENTPGGMDIHGRTTLYSGAVLTFGNRASSTRYLITNSDILNIKGAKLINNYSEITHNRNFRGILNANNGDNSYPSKIVMSSGTINTDGYAIYSESGTLNPQLASTIEISGTEEGTIITTYVDGAIASRPNMNNGSINISGGTITSEGQYGLDLSLGSNIAKITGGTITGDRSGIYGNGSVTLGTNDSSVSITEPSRSGRTYGIDTTGGIQLSFYDGIITGEENQSINGTVGAKPTGYDVYKENADSRETAILTANYAEYNGDEYIGGYATLASALTGVTSGNKIKVMHNATETTAATLGNKTATLDLNGHTITTSSTITNGGTLDIYSSVNGGIVEGTGTNLIVNNGTLTTNETSSSSTMTIRNKSATGSNVITNNASKNVTLNTNTTITFSVATTASSYRHLVSNNGILEIAGATLTNTASGSTYDRGINNAAAGARVIVTGGTIQTGGHTIRNSTGTGTAEGSEAVVISGTNTIMSSAGEQVVNNAAGGKVVINGGSLSTTTTPTLANGSTGTIEINGGSMLATNSGCISNTAGGTITVNGGTIEGTTGNAIHNSAGGIINVDGGSITGAQGIFFTDASTGTMNITGGTITSTGTSGTAALRLYAGTANISGSPIINAARYGIFVVGGTATITGGTITTTGTSDATAVWMNGGTVTLGTNENPPKVNTNAPDITGGAKGVGVASGTFNFYDGVIRGQNGEGSAIVGTVTGKPTGYEVQKTTANSIETAILGVSQNYAEYNGSTFVAYRATLANALTNVTSGNTIQVLRNTTETAAASLASGKTAKLNLAGNKITLSGVALTNNGTLDIYSSNAGGILEGTAAAVITNAGTLTTSNTSGSKAVTIRNTSATSSAYVITNNSGKTATLKTNTTLTFTQGTTANRYLVNNLGTLNIQGATLLNRVSTSTYDRGVYSNATGARVAMSSGTIDVNGTGIYNVKGTGTASGSEAVSISGSGTVINATGGTAVYNGATGKMLITAGTITSSTYALYNNVAGEIEVRGGTITSGSGSEGIYNKVADGTITVSGGTIKGTSGIYNYAAGIINVSGGNITGLTAQGIRGNTGIVSISGSSTIVKGVTYGASVNAGTLTITAGKIEATGGTGAYSKGTLTIGTNEETPSVSTTVPEIIGTVNGVQVASGTFNFYDGKLTGAVNKSITGTVADTPEGYVIQKTTADNKETSILIASSTVYYEEYVGTGSTLRSSYKTLADATTNAVSGNTIKVIANKTETANATVPAGKTLKLNLNGKTITLNNKTLTNEGTLDIYTTVNSAKLQGSATNVIINNGTLTTNGTSSSYTMTVQNTSATGTAVITNNDGKSVTLNTKTTVTFSAATTGSAYRHLVTNNGVLTIAGATLTNTKTSSNYDRGINNAKAGARVVMSSGTITTYGHGIRNSAGTGKAAGSEAVSITGGSITSTNEQAVLNDTSGKVLINTTGTIKSTNSGALTNKTNGTIEIQGGTITSNTNSNSVGNLSTGTIKVTGGTLTGNNGIWNESTGKIVVTGGSITGSGTEGVGLRVYKGTATISSSNNTVIQGVKGGVVATTGKIIVTGGSITATNGVGAQVQSGGTITLGVKNSTINNTPSITGTTYGVQKYVGALFNFYDGTIQGATGKSISTDPDDTPDGYGVIKTQSGANEIATLGTAATLKASNDTTYFLGTPIKREDVTTITIVNSLSGSTDPDVVAVYDVSANSDNSVKVWYKLLYDPEDQDHGNTGIYAVYIGTNRSKIYANADSSYLFYNTCRYSNNSMSNMLTGLDLLDTSNVTNMSHMFDGWGNRARGTLNINFDTSNVTNMSYMFKNFGEEYITLTLGPNFDTSHVTNMTEMFNGAFKLTARVRDLDIRTMTFTAVTSSTNIFKDCGAIGTKVYVKDNTARTWVINHKNSNWSDSNIIVPES